ncbi:MAG: hypothetical protein R2707_19550 [Acidimicrobiales bacterium]
MDDRALGPEIVREVARWGRTVAAADPVMLRRRPAAETWSALEYACHVRDLLPVMAARVQRMLEDDCAELGWWDHEAAAVEDRYNEQVPVLVIEAMTANARAFAASLASVEGDSWDRSAERRPGEHFTVRGIARFVLHEVIHHRDDATRSLKGVFP